MYSVFLNVNFNIFKLYYFFKYIPPYEILLRCKFIFVFISYPIFFIIHVHNNINLTF